MATAMSAAAAGAGAAGNGSARCQGCHHVLHFQLSDGWETVRRALTGPGAPPGTASAAPGCEAPPARGGGGGARVRRASRDGEDERRPEARTQPPVARSDPTGRMVAGAGLAMRRLQLTDALLRRSGCAGRLGVLRGTEDHPHWCHHLRPPHHLEDTVSRKVFDTLTSAGGIVAVVVLLIAGGLLTWGNSFANSNVHGQLASSPCTSPRCPTAASIRR